MGRKSLTRIEEGFLQKKGVAIGKNFLRGIRRCIEKCVLKRSFAGLEKKSGESLKGKVGHAKG